MNENREFPFGVYGNLCVALLRTYRLYHWLRFFDIVPVFLEVQGIASGGDLRKSLGFPLLSNAGGEEILINYPVAASGSSRFIHFWSHLLGGLTSPLQTTGRKYGT
jgi:hypothetical protein